MLRAIAPTSILLVLAFSVGAQTAAQQAPAAPAQTEARTPDVPYVPTPHRVVDAMLRVAKVGKRDVLYDLGSGDGRIPIAAAQKFGITRSVGIDLDQELIDEANRNRIKAGVDERVKFLKADLFESDVSDATVITLYLLPRLNLQLIPKLLKETKPGTRVVSHGFNMGSWKAEQALEVEGTAIYLWTVPAPGTPSYEAAMAAAKGN